MITRNNLKPARPPPSPLHPSGWGLAELRRTNAGRAAMTAGPGQGRQQLDDKSKGNVSASLNNSTTTSRTRRRGGYPSDSGRDTTNISQAYVVRLSSSGHHQHQVPATPRPDNTDDPDNSGDRRGEGGATGDVPSSSRPAAAATGPVGKASMRKKALSSPQPSSPRGAPMKKKALRPHQPQPRFDAPTKTPRRVRPAVAAALAEVRAEQQQQQRAATTPAGDEPHTATTPAAHRIRTTASGNDDEVHDGAAVATPSNTNVGGAEVDGAATASPAFIAQEAASVIARVANAPIDRILEWIGDVEETLDSDEDGGGEAEEDVGEITRSSSRRAADDDETLRSQSPASMRRIRTRLMGALRATLAVKLEAAIKADGSATTPSAAVTHRHYSPLPSPRAWQRGSSPPPSPRRAARARATALLLAATPPGSMDPVMESRRQAQRAATDAAETARRTNERLRLRARRRQVEHILREQEAVETAQQLAGHPVRTEAHVTMTLRLASAQREVAARRIDSPDVVNDTRPPSVAAGHDRAADSDDYDAGPGDAHRDRDATEQARQQPSARRMTSADVMGTAQRLFHELAAAAHIDASDSIKFRSVFNSPAASRWIRRRRAARGEEDEVDVDDLLRSVQ